MATLKGLEVGESIPLSYSIGLPAQVAAVPDIFPVKLGHIVAIGFIHMDQAARQASGTFLGQIQA